MAKKFWWKSALFVMAAGTTLAFGGCWGEWIQRILIDSAFDRFPFVLGGQI